MEATVAPDTAAASGLRDLKGPIDPTLAWRWERVALAAVGLALLLAGLLFVAMRNAPRFAFAGFRYVELTGY